MPMPKQLTILSLAAVISLLAGASGEAQQRQQPQPQPQPRFELGRAPSAAEVAGWNIDVRTPSVGLPKGSGNVARGEKVYAERCAACHGDKGQGSPMDRLVGGIGSLATDKPVKTVGSYWPYAETLYDYIHRAMPFDSPQSLSSDEVYAVTAYVLFLNGIVPKDAVMSAETLPKVKMPNRDGFDAPDPRPDVRNEACMKNCPPLKVSGSAPSR